MAEKKKSKKKGKGCNIITAEPVLEAMSESEKYNLFKKSTLEKKGKKIKKLGDSDGVYVSNLHVSNDSDSVDTSDFDDINKNDDYDD